MVAALSAAILLSLAAQSNIRASAVPVGGVSQFEGTPQHIYNVDYTFPPLNTTVSGSIVVDPTVYHGMLIVDLSSMNHSLASGYVAAIDLETGGVVWKDMLPNQFMTQPIVANGLVIIGVGNNELNFSNPNATNSLLHVVRGTGINYIAAINPANGKLVWRFNTTGADMPTPLYYKGRVIEATGGGYAYALNSSNGDVIWATSLFVMPYSMIHTQFNASANPNVPGFFDSMSSPVLLDGIVYFGVSDPGVFYAINATTGKIIWDTRFPGAVGGTGGTSAAIYAPANIIVTGYAGPRSYKSSAAVQPSNSFSVAASQNKAVQPDKFISPVIVGLNMDNGNIIWSYTEIPRAQPLSPPIEIDPITIWNATAFSDSPSAGILYAFNVSTGAVLWSFRTGIDASNPNVFGGYLFLDSSNGTVFTLHLNGTLVSEHNLGVPMGPGEPVVVGDKLLLYGTNGMIKTVPLAYLENRSYR